MTAKKTRRIDFAAAIQKAEQPVASANVTFAELCRAYCATVYNDAENRLRKWIAALGDRVHLSDDETAKLLGASFAGRDLRFAAFVHLLSDTGARRGEILERRWKDVDLDRCTINCQFTKTGVPRVLFFTETTAALMDRTLPKRDPESLPFEGRLPGVPINYRRAWLELTKAVGRPDLHQHDLRHVAALRLRSPRH